MNKKLNTLLITGGLGGIGINIVHYFLNNNYNVIIVDNKSKNFFSKINFKNKINFVHYFKIDLSKAKTAKLKYDFIKKKFKIIDVLINCAGVQYVQKIESFPDNKWEKILSINLSSSFYSCKSILPLMKKNKGGRIINIASVHGQVASVNKSAYVASKHGLIGLTKAIALETATLPITCNAICPGWVNTPLISKQIKDNAKKNKSTLKIAAQHMLKDKQPSLQFISSSSISSLAYYLCSEEASEITGSSINLDGCWTTQ